MLLLFAAGVVRAESPIAFTDAEVRLILQHADLPAEPPADPTNRVSDDPRAARLGQFLFFDPRLSSNGLVSCATCHSPDMGFADGQPLPSGVGGEGPRHSQSLFNVALNRWYFWDGRADTLWSQALKPLENVRELASSRTALARLVAADASLRRAYEALFEPLADLSDPERFPPTAKPTPQTPESEAHRAWSRMSAADQAAVDRVFVHVGKSLAAYQRRLVSRDSPFDRFAAALRAGDAGAADYPLDAQRGLKLFIGRGNCRLCHSGPNFTDGEFHNTGVPPLRNEPQTDAGRFAGIDALLRDPFNAGGEHSDDRAALPAQLLNFLNNRPENWGLFKTPSLRSVSETAPYMHQGQFESLEQVVRFYSTRENAVPMGHHRQETILLPLNLTPEEARDLVAFLRSLRGAPLPDDLIRPPPGPSVEAVGVAPPAAAP